MRRGFCLLLGVLACATSAPSPPTASPVRLTLPGSVDGATLAVGQELALALEANATTGYRWELAGPLPGVVALVDPGTYREPPDADASVGTGGVTAFVFRAVRPGTGVVLGVYRRPWESGVAPGRSRRVEIEVLAGRAPDARPAPGIAARSGACPPSRSTRCWRPASSSPPE